MDRNMGRQGPMSMSPGMMRRPAGMPQSGRDFHSQNHSSYQTPPHGAAVTGGGIMYNSGNNGPPQTSPLASSSAMHQMHPVPQNHQQLYLQTPQIQHSQHDELIRYINEAWNSITTDKSQKPPVFYKSVPEPRLPGFTPFDLEGWWGQRLVHQLNISTHGHQ